MGRCLDVGAGVCWRCSANLGTSSRSFESLPRSELDRAYVKSTLRGWSHAGWGFEFWDLPIMMAIFRECWKLNDSSMCKSRDESLGSVWEVETRLPLNLLEKMLYLSFLTSSLFLFISNISQDFQDMIYQDIPMLKTWQNISWVNATLILVLLGSTAGIARWAWRRGAATLCEIDLQWCPDPPAILQVWVVEGCLQLGGLWLPSMFWDQTGINPALPCRGNSNLKHTTFLSGFFAYEHLIVSNVYLPVPTFPLDLDSTSLFPT